MTALATLSTSERDELRSSVRSFLASKSPTEQVRSVVAREPGFDRDLWTEMVDLGWTSLHVRPEVGGAGSGYADLAVVLHELGRAIIPSPFLASGVLATTALQLSDNDALASQLLAALTAGEMLGSVAFAGSSGSYEVSRLTTTWERTDGVLRVSGTAGFVPDADVADVMVVAARNTDGVTALMALETTDAGVRVQRSATVDQTQRLFSVSFDDVVLTDDRMLCEAGPRTEEVLRRLLAVGTIAAACDAAGVAEQALERAADYAKERTQFGKPIGSFQAVKHHCANMAIAVSASRAAVRGASEALDDEASDWSAAADVTSSYVGPACAEACALALRVHGGIGFTWEHESHLYLKRVKLDEVLFGTPSWHRRRLADTVLAAAGREERRAS